MPAWFSFFQIYVWFYTESIVLTSILKNISFTWCIYDSFIFLLVLARFLPKESQIHILPGCKDLKIKCIRSLMGHSQMTSGILRWGGFTLSLHCLWSRISIPSVRRWRGLKYLQIYFKTKLKHTFFFIVSLFLFIVYLFNL